MGEAENEPADRGNFGADPPLTVELLADLQAGLLDDETAAHVRRKVRTDPEAAGILHALNQVRRDVAALGADPATAPEASAVVTTRISVALRSAGPSAAHSIRPPLHPARVAAGVAGLAAVVAAVAVGTTALVNAPSPAPSTEVTAERITVSTPPMAIPLSDAEIRGLLSQAPDFGALGDLTRRASCLSGLGYPAATPVLGARPIDINARSGVLLVLPGDTPDKIAVFAVAPNCNAADTGLLASTVVARA